VAAALGTAAPGMAASMGAAATGMAATEVTAAVEAAAAVGTTATGAAEAALPAEGDEGSNTACAAAAKLKAALLFSFRTSCLFLSFSLLLALGGRFLARLRAVGGTEE
jgi:hypothetical protein